MNGRLPVQARRISPQREAVAPYNFVPLPEAVYAVVDAAEWRELDSAAGREELVNKRLPSHDRYYTKRYTGYFDVKLRTLSPLYVRAGLSTAPGDHDELSEFARAEEEKSGRAPASFRAAAKNQPKFFYTQQPERPVIPGSSLRGMLRDLLEIVSYGKVTRVTDKQLIYRAVGDPTSLGAWYREQVLGPNQDASPNMRFDYPALRLRGGYLCRHEGGWAIRPAVQHAGESFVHVEYSAAQPVIGGQGRQQVHEVFVRPMSRTAPNRGRHGPGTLTLNLAVTRDVVRRASGAAAPAELVAAVLVESGHMGGQHAKHMHCAIYAPDDGADVIPILPGLWQTYEEDRDMNRGIKTRKLTAEDQPLFYLVDANEQLVFFGPTIMFRLPYQHSIGSRIPRHLREALTIDLADALFGFVRERTDFAAKQLPPQGVKSRAYASRVSVTDATLLNDDVPPEKLWLLGTAQGALVPKILGSPKPTTFQHYLVQPDAARAELSHYDSPKRDADGVVRGANTVLRGHKLYWHQGDKSAEAIRAKHPDEDPAAEPQSRNLFERGPDGHWQVKDASTQHTQINPVRAGVAFKFRVYFENLNAIELGALKWVLTLPGEPGRKYCHSLGMGKPLGLGAVKLDVTLQLVDRTQRYAMLLDDVGWQTGVSATPLENDPLDQFEQALLRWLAQLVGRTDTHLYQNERIARLLKMLEWRDQPTGLDRKRYQNLDSFRPRPVLPDPLDVA